VIACYARVSTADQSLARQVRSTLEYSRDHHDADLGTTKDLTVIADAVEEGMATSPAEYGDVGLYFDKSTGTDTNRDGYRDLMADLEEESFDAVVVHSVSRMSRSIRDLDRAAENIVEEYDTELHILSEGFDLVPGDRDPFQRAMFRLLGVFAELEADLAQQRTKEGIATRQADEEYHHGHPPLGFIKDDGYLIEKENIDQIRTVLRMVALGEMSKRKAARELDTSRRTIGRALDRAELYGIESESASPES